MLDLPLPLLVRSMLALACRCFRTEGEALAD